MERPVHPKNGESAHLTEDQVPEATGADGSLPSISEAAGSTGDEPDKVEKQVPAPRELSEYESPGLQNYDTMDAYYTTKQPIIGHRIIHYRH